MMFLFLILMLGDVCSLPEEIQKCDYCRENMARCLPGRELRSGSGCVRCVCTADHVYQCEQSAECHVNHENENSILSKPSCEPRMMYLLGSLVCMCSQGGSWPHAKCEIAFPTLHELEQGESQSNVGDIVTHKEKCEPFSYLKKGCNVCRCSASGVVVEEQCTRNECPRAAAPPPAADRRVSAIARREGSICQAGSWYAISPCQLCYCQAHNQLACSSRLAAAAAPLSLGGGAYSLTQCGEIVSELYKIAPESFGILIDVLRSNVPNLLAQSPSVIPPVGPGSAPLAWSQPFTPPSKLQSWTVQNFLATASTTPTPVGPGSELLLAWTQPSITPYKIQSWTEQNFPGHASNPLIQSKSVVPPARLGSEPMAWTQPSSFPFKLQLWTEQTFPAQASNHLAQSPSVVPLAGPVSEPLQWMQASSLPLQLQSWSEQTLTAQASNPLAQSPPVVPPAGPGSQPMPWTSPSSLTFKLQSWTEQTFPAKVPNPLAQSPPAVPPADPGSVPLPWTQSSSLPLKLQSWMGQTFPARTFNPLAQSPSVIPPAGPGSESLVRLQSSYLTSNLHPRAEQNSPTSARVSSTPSPITKQDATLDPLVEDSFTPNEIINVMSSTSSPNKVRQEMSDVPLPTFSMFEDIKDISMSREE